MLVLYASCVTVHEGVTVGDSAGGDVDPLQPLECYLPLGRAEFLLEPLVRETLSLPRLWKDGSADLDYLARQHAYVDQGVLEWARQQREHEYRTYEAEQTHVHTKHSRRTRINAWTSPPPRHMLAQPYPLPLYVTLSRKTQI